jgi:hypothetical protein
MKPERWAWLAFCVAAPTVIMSSVVIGMLRAENRMDWNWVMILGIAIGVCGVSGWLGHAINEKGNDK